MSSEDTAAPSWKWGCDLRSSHLLPWLLPLQSQDHQPHISGGPTQAESSRAQRSPEPGGAALALCAPPRG